MAKQTYNVMVGNTVKSAIGEKAAIQILQRGMCCDSEAVKKQLKDKGEAWVAYGFTQGGIYPTQNSTQNK